MKYGVKIPFPDGELLWVTQGDSKFNLQPILFDSEQEAIYYASTVWGNVAKVMPYVIDIV